MAILLALLSLAVQSNPLSESFHNLQVDLTRLEEQDCDTHITCSDCNNDTACHICSAEDDPDKYPVIAEDLPPCSPLEPVSCCPNNDPLLQTSVVNTTPGQAPIN
eukprot:c16030_g1_i1.p1 GENE.c16030_g1_i1~~c16030_g1_i1.p1  ORF type:complete len:116 (-),score=22.27 c16030_g1_i1:50-364(-)